MPASTDIYGTIQQARPVNRLAELAQVMQVQGLQQQGEMGRMKMDALRRDTEQENALSAAYSSALGADGKIDRNKLLSAAAAGGLGAKIPGIQKGFAEQDKAGAEAQGKLLENTKKRVDLAGQAFGFVRANPTLENANSAIDFLGTNGVWDATQVAQYKAQVAADPTKIGPLAEQAFRAALDAKEQLAKYETRDTGGSVQTLAIDPVTGQVKPVSSVAKTQSPDSIASIQVQRERLAEDKRHHGVTESNQTTALTKPFEITGPDGNPVLVQQDKQGNIRPVPGYGPKQGASKPLTDAQAKANLFGTRMQESHRILSGLEDQGVTNSGLIKNTVQGAVGLTPFMGDKLSDAAGSVMNVMPGVLGGPNESQQRVEQARRDFLNAVLRRESGAVISPQEFANANQQYFPQPGDSKAVLEQKRRNRDLAIRGLEVEVPGGFRSAPTGTGASPAAAPAAAGKVVDFGSLK